MNYAPLEIAEAPWVTRKLEWDIRSVGIIDDLEENIRKGSPINTDLWPKTLNGNIAWSPTFHS